MGVAGHGSGRTREWQDEGVEGRSSGRTREWQSTGVAGQGQDEGGVAGWNARMRDFLDRGVTGG